MGGVGGRGASTSACALASGSAFPILNRFDGVCRALPVVVIKLMVEVL